MLKENKKPKISRTKIDENPKGCFNIKKNISFSFLYITTNKKYCLDFFSSKQLRDELDARQKLGQLLRTLSKTTWLDTFRKRKDEFGGTEQIALSEMNFMPSGDYFSEDANVLSFRFGTGEKYRLLGIRDEPCQTLYIIGFDFNFSAYNHG